MPDKEAARNNGETPVIRSFQFDDYNIGSIKNSVNLFRGDVNFSLSVLNLSSRDGMDINVNILYTSNIQNIVSTWNLSSPTGILGLGWSLPYERIEVFTNNNLSIESNKYFLVTGENKGLLLQSRQSWNLLDISTEFITVLNNGNVNYALSEIFAENGILLSIGSRITVLDPGKWEIFDNINERIFKLCSDSDKIEVFDGGLSFESQSYQFWKIQYYPIYEKWLIVKENGFISIYGGGIIETNGIKSTAENSIQWGICWGNWIGDSIINDGNQSQYVKAWNLSSIKNQWNDSIKYSYLFEENRIGENGLSFTKACYLSKITDAFNREIIFNYNDKIFNDPDTEPYKSREYIDPHRRNAKNIEPNAFQDCYETKYLDSIELHSPHSEKTLIKIAFEYYDLMNVTDINSATELYGNTYKRYLKKVIQYNSECENLPDINFDYYWNVEDPHPGALKSITYPQGGKITYTYEQKKLPICNRSITIPRPDSEQSEYWVPRVWFGDDYSVVIWFNTDTSKLQMKVYTWLGYWFCWESDEIKADLKLDSLNVLSGNDFFALTFEIKNEDKSELILFHKDENRTGIWKKYNNNFVFNSLNIKYSAGENFLTVLDQDGGKLCRFTWTWADDSSGERKTWQQEQFDLSEFSITGSAKDHNYYITGTNNYYLIFCYDTTRETIDKKNSLYLFYIDGLNKWHNGDIIYPDDIYIQQSSYTDTFFFSPGSSFASATHIINIGSKIEYKIQIFQWDKNYKFIETIKSGLLKSGSAVQIPAVICNDCLIASGPYLFRFNGIEWLYKKVEISMPEQSPNIFWFAYGDDVILMTENSSSQAITTICAFDPDNDSIEWNTAQERITDVTHTVPYRTMQFYPSAGINYLSAGRYNDNEKTHYELYNRGTSTNWQNPLSNPILTLNEKQIINTTTIQNQAPDFFIYLYYEEIDGDLVPINTNVINLESGRVISQESFTEQIFKIYKNDGSLETKINGKIPGGIGSFFTFPLDQELNHADHITLRRYLQGTVNDTVTDYSVVKLEIDNGYEINNSFYEYNDESACCDPTGTVVKFYKVCAYMGTDSKENSKDGFIEINYINGLHPETEGIEYPEVSEYNNVRENYSVLDGLLDSQYVYDKNENIVAYCKNDWIVKKTINLKNETVFIQGAYVLLAREQSMQDNVQGETSYYYDYSSGQRNELRTQQYNSSGSLETRVENILYGYNVYVELQRLNILTAVVQTKRKIIYNDTGNEIVTGVTVSRIKPWSFVKSNDSGEPELSIFDRYDDYIWLGGDESPDFTAWNCNETPSSDWFFSQRIKKRTNNGLQLEFLNELGQCSSLLYDKNFCFPCATFYNAGITSEQASYLGFEDYEQDSLWIMYPGEDAWRNYIDKNTAFTGKQSLKLDNVSGTGNCIKRTFKPGTQHKSYIITCWYKTGYDFVQNDMSGLMINILNNEEEIISELINFENTSGEWKYLTNGINLPDEIPESANIEIILSAMNDSTESVWIDYIRFSPLLSEFAANVIDMEKWITTAEIGPNNQILRNIFDDFNRIISRVGPSENVGMMQFQFFSQQNGDEFNPDFPNSGIKIIGKGYGYYDNFLKNSNDYSKNWSTNNTDEWSVIDNSLLHTGNNNSEITLINPDIKERYSATISIRQQEEITEPVGIKIGDNITIEWNPDTMKWQMFNHLNDKTVLPLITDEHNSPGKHWLIHIYNNTLFFYADGLLLFSYIADENIIGQLTIFCGNYISFYNIIVSDDTTFTISYADGTGNTRQNQLLFEEHCIIDSGVYDNLGRAAVKTKSASLPPTDESPLLTFRKSVITGFNWITGIMTGEISDYYSSQGEGFSDDKGFPYSRELYESSPLGRIIETGQPGKDLAIRDLDTTTPEERHTTKTYYYSNGHDNFMNQFVPDEYLVVKTIDPDGHTVKAMKDKAGNIIASGILTDAEKNTYNLTTHDYQYTESGKTAFTYLPNHFQENTSSDNNAFVIINYSDMMGNNYLVSSPDNGNLTSIYEPSGLLRFSQDEKGRNQGYYIYLKYDELGRIIETGHIIGEWDELILQEYADNNPSWPLNQDTWFKKYEYDGNGNDAFSMSRLISVTVNNIEKGLIKEEYIYDIYGNIKECIQHFPGGNKYSTKYSYDNQQYLTHQEYPQTGNNPAPVLEYKYNQLDNLSFINNDNYSSYTSYNYFPGGPLRRTTVGKKNGSSYPQDYSYTSPGNLKSIITPYYEQELYYNLTKNGDPGYYSGLISEIFHNYKIPGKETDGYLYIYTYDTSGNLASAKCFKDSILIPEKSMGIDQPITYDPDGNILNSSIGNNDKNYSYYDKTNQIKNTTGTDDENFIYDNNGNIIKSIPRGILEIKYNLMSGLTESVKLSDEQQINFIYSPGNKRLIKEAVSGSQLYIYGTGNSPILELYINENSENITRYYLYSPGNIKAFIEDNKTYFIISDHLQSSRILIDENGNVINSYDYLPFGDLLLNNNIETIPLSYLFTGQEYDKETGLYNFKARLYDTRLGRFYSVDPAGEFASPYIYAGNNPVSMNDPSGTLTSNQTCAMIGMVGGGLAVAGSIVAAILTIGAATPVVVAAGIAESAIIGAGTSSLVYSATNYNEHWNLKEWGVNTAFGAAAGGISAAAGLGAGVLAAQIAAQATSQIGKQVAIQIASGIIAGAAIDSTVNSLTTLATNTVFNSNASLGTAAWTGAAGGAFGGMLGGIGAMRSLIASRYKPNAAAIANYRGAPVGGRGLTAMRDRHTGIMYLENFGENLHNPVGYQQSHGNQIYNTFGSIYAVHHVPVDGGNHVLLQNNLEGFALKNIAGRNAEFTFGSYTINYHNFNGANRPAAARRFIPLGDRLGIMMGLRSSPLRIKPKTRSFGCIHEVTKIDRVVAFLLRTPFY